MRSLHLATVVGFFGGSAPEAYAVFFCLLLRRGPRQQLFDATQVDDLAHLDVLVAKPAGRNPEENMGNTIDLTAALQASRLSSMRMARHVGPAGRGLLRLAVLCAAAALAACTTPMFRPASAPTAAQTSAPPPQTEQEAVRPHRLAAGPASKIAHPPIDHSGQTEDGKASFYAGDFAGKKMANGQSFSPTANVAASKTLPLGTTAKVTDLDTGKSAVVKVEDRGPHVRGRVLDVSPKVAENLSMKKNGTAHVVVKPIAEPKSAHKPAQDEQAQP